MLPLQRRHRRPGVTTLIEPSGKYQRAHTSRRLSPPSSLQLSQRRNYQRRTRHRSSHSENSHSRRRQGTHPVGALPARRPAVPLPLARRIERLAARLALPHRSPSRRQRRIHMHPPQRVTPHRTRRTVARRVLRTRPRPPIVRMSQVPRLTRPDQPTTPHTHRPTRPNQRHQRRAHPLMLRPVPPGLTTTPQMSRSVAGHVPTRDVRRDTRTPGVLVGAVPVRKSGPPGGGRPAGPREALWGPLRAC